MTRPLELVSALLDESEKEYIYEGKHIKCIKRNIKLPGHTTLGGHYTPPAFQNRLYLTDGVTYLRLLDSQTAWEDEPVDISFEEMWENYPWKWFVDGIVRSKTTVPPAFHNYKVSPFEVFDQLGYNVKYETATQFYEWLSDIKFDTNMNSIINFKVVDTEGKLRHKNIAVIKNGKYSLL